MPVLSMPLSGSLQDLAVGIKIGYLLWGKAVVSRTDE